MGEVYHVEPDQWLYMKMLKESAAWSEENGNDIQKIGANKERALLKEELQKVRSSD